MIDLAERVANLDRQVRFLEAAALWLAENADDLDGAIERMRPTTPAQALTRQARVYLADVNLDGYDRGAGEAATGAVTVEPVDPQAAFVKLAERFGSYKLAAREHPELWAAAVTAADLNGEQWEVQ
jgi:hypothetical protein